MTPNARGDDAQTSGAMTPPAAMAGLPRNGAQRSMTHDGQVDVDPLRLGAGGVDAMPDGIRPARTADELAGKNPFGAEPPARRP